MKVSKRKCKVLHLGRNNPMHQYRLGAIQLECSFVEKDTGVFVDKRLNRKQECALEARKDKSLLGCFKQNPANKLRKETFAFHLALMRQIRNFGSSSGLSRTSETWIYWCKSSEEH